MNSGKKRSGFQITSVTSDLNQTPASQSSPSVLLTTFQSEASSVYDRHGSSSQPTSPSLKRKHVSHDAPGQGAGSSSRFRVVRLAVGGSGGRGRGESYRRGRWMCMDFTERQEAMGFRRVMDSMRHAHSLESLEMIGQDKDRGGGYFSRIRGDTAHLLTLPIKSREGARPVSHSGPPSPTHQEPINSQLLDHKEAREAPLSPRQRHVPPPIRLVTAGQTPATFSLDQAFFGLPGDTSTSSSSLIAIDNKIEQAMDLVKSHLMLAVREEVELLKEQIKELQEKNQQLERENHILRALTHNTTQHNT